MRGLAPHEAAYQGDDDGHAGGGGDEVVHRKPHHLGEVAGRQLAAVVLPVGVGDEADRGVQRQLPGKGREFLRVERQQVLQHQHREKRYEQHQVEENHGPGIALPAHLLVPVHPADPVEQVFTGSKDRRQEGPLPLEDPGHEGAERLHQGQQDDEKENCFQPFI